MLMTWRQLWVWTVRWGPCGNNQRMEFVTHTHTHTHTHTSGLAHHHLHDRNAAKHSASTVCSAATADTLSTRCERLCLRRQRCHTSCPSTLPSSHDGPTGGPYPRTSTIITATFYTSAVRTAAAAVNSTCTRTATLTPLQALMLRRYQCRHRVNNFQKQPHFSRPCPLLSRIRRRPIAFKPP
jgi:hypothetical protein